jgi:hypothetical protein
MSSTRFSMQGIVGWTVERAARKSVATLASNGLVDEGIYLAVKTLAEGWQRPAADSLVSGFRRALDQSGDFDLKAWQRIVDSQRSKNPADDLYSQIIVQSPEASGYIENEIARASSGANLGQKVVSAGMGLIDAGMFGAGLSFLSSAAYSDFAGAAVFPALRDAIARTPSRAATVVSGKDAVLVTRDLANTAAQLAATDHYVSALHTDLLEPLVSGDNERFARIGTRILTAAFPNSDHIVNDTMKLAFDLGSKGYRGQAVDLITSATGIPYADQPAWRRMYMTIDQAVATSNASRLAARIVPPFANRMGVDLSPLSNMLPPAAPTIPADAPVTPAAQPTARHVNCRIEEDPSFPPDQFDVCVNIGPKDPGAMGGPFVEPDWEGREYIDLRIVLSGPEADVRPAWRSVRLPKVGATDDVRFRVSSSVVGILQLWVRVYADETNTLLAEHQLRISVAGSKQVA